MAKSALQKRHSVQHLFDRAVQAQQAGHSSVALAAYEQVLRRNPDHGPSWVNRALQLEALGDLQGLQSCSAPVLRWYDHLLQQNPCDLDAHLMRGNALRWANRHDEAIASYDRMLELAPTDVRALCNRGNARQDKGEFAAAAEDYAQALAIEPANASLWSFHGVALCNAGLPEQALASQLRALELLPDNAQIRINTAFVLQELKRWSQALPHLEAALALHPGHPAALLNLSVVLDAMDRHAEAVQNLDHCLALHPNLVLAHAQRGVALTQLNQLDAALEAFDRALALQPNHDMTLWNKALALLKQGNFESGWPLHESRWLQSKHRGNQRHTETPPWLGREPVAGRTLLLHAEQGLGDTLQMCRYAPLLALAGARVVLQVPQPLVSLLRCLPGVAQVIEDNGPVPPYDLHCPLMSLPLALGTTLSTIPSAPCYLAADPRQVHRWATLLGPKQGLRIGLAWSGNATHSNDRNRSLPLATLLAALPSGNDYICLQKELRDSDRQALADNTLGVRFFGDHLGDFADTAALCTLLDLVISVDTSVAHLAGALGTNTWLLLPLAPDFRWLLDRTDSPWYPSFTLLRQDAAGDWTQPLQLIRQALSS